MEDRAQQEGPRVAILGAGANGTIIGAALADAEIDVTLIDQWPANVEEIRAHGARIELQGATRVTRVAAVHLHEVAEIRESFDVVLLLVKAYDTRWATMLIAPLLHAESVVVGVQNGMTTEEIAEIIGPERTLGAVIEVTSAMDKPGLVERHSAHEQCWFAVGALDARAVHHVPEVAALLRHIGIVEETDDILSAKWMKLVLNVAELVPSALLDLSIAEAARIPAMRALMLAAGNEAVAVAQAAGLAIRPIFGMEGEHAADPSTYVATILDELVCSYVLEHSRSTVLQDWQKRRRSEVRELHGSVIDLGERHGVFAPVNQAMLEFGLAVETGAITAGIGNLAALEARATELREARSEIRVLLDGGLDFDA